ncbi:hypothetical protein [Pedobacter punctiformis]|uniref:Auto-transporter adhesin head GIN domain-containing protein n=1 Tax=Pedobacter punctiformis TaxID=3004097 RepID=A0ABT4L9P5_9SPHI|nr:hypothetical protein [Pedobacter sp. HCMS5-2]MCZ4244628.1 hypothetical protein [Pedobacter sp. HCMS5-2]
MKTSYKILVALAFLIVVSLFGFNLMMRAKYKKGAFAEYPSALKEEWKYDMVIKEIPPFKHLVIDGAVITSNDRRVLWNPVCLINSSNTSKNALGIIKYLEPLLKYHIDKDTLYITLEKNNINEKTLTSPVYDPTIFLAVNSLQSATLKNVSARIDSLVSKQSFKINTLNNTSFLVNDLKTDSLFIDAKEKSSITLNNTSTTSAPTNVAIANLYYHVQQPASIYIEDTKRLGKISAIGLKGDQTEFRNERLKIISTGK